MSDITITTANLSKFSRRLQKALAEEFNQDVKLSTANKLFAKSVGKRNLYELQEAISKTPFDKLTDLPEPASSLEDEKKKIELIDVDTRDVNLTKYPVLEQDVQTFPMVVMAKDNADLSLKLEAFCHISGQHLEDKNDGISLVYDVLSVRKDVLFAIIYKRGANEHKVTTEDKMYAVVKYVSSGLLKKSDKDIMSEVSYIWPNVNLEKIYHTMNLMKIYNKTVATQKAKAKKMKLPLSG